MPSTGWLVGHEVVRPPAALGGAEQRSARLAARLEAYSRYGALVAEEAVAMLRGDTARAEALASERASITEHYAELRAAAESGGGAPGTAAFGDLLTDALREVDHQSEVDLALRRQLVRMAEGLRALPAPSSIDVEGGAVGEQDAGAGEGQGTVAGVVASFAGSLVEARSQGLGGALSGYFPGVGAGAGMELATAYAPEEGRDGDGRRLDVRF